VSDLNAFIAQMPKAELHLHIEGSLEPDLLFELGRKNDISLPFSSVDEVRAAYQFTKLQDFLDIYYQGMSVLQTEQDFFDLTWAYLTRIHQQKVIHTEIFFDPQGHTARGISFDTVIKGIWRALEKAQTDYGLTSKLIMCFLRHLSEDEAIETLKQALPYKDKICAVGLDSSEIGHPPAKFQRVFGKARQEGFLSVAHAGEEGPPAYIYEALDLLKIDRLDHGNRALEDPGLIKRLANEQMALTVCPLSNMKLAVVKDMKDHPLRRMLQAGLKATINSDDPAYFGGYITENYQSVASALMLTKEEIITLARNGFEASFCSDQDKQAMLAKLDSYIASCT
jgi:adenine deaminase